MLREGVLAGTAMAFAGDGALGRAVAERAPALGASEGVDVLVYDPGDAPMLEALDGAWDAIRPVATAAMIERGGGRILLLAPPPGGAEAAAVRAGLENLARTLSVEWARFQIRPVAILPGSAAGPPRWRSWRASWPRPRASTSRAARSSSAPLCAAHRLLHRVVDVACSAGRGASRLGARALRR